MEDLKKEIKEELEMDSIVILVLVHRSSESLYNHKTKKLYVIFKPRYPTYEEQLVRNVKVITVYTGVFQEYSKYDVEDVIEELRKHYEVHEIDIH